MKKRFNSILTKAAAMLLVMLLTTTTAWAATVQFPIYTGDEGTASKPYQIKTIDDLNKLAQDVNSGEGYYGKYFKLMNDITYTHTTDWDAATSQENNFTPIGVDGPFYGIFDGQGHTISGIRFYSTDSFQGLFGYIGTSSTVRNVILDDTHITGKDHVGGIVGINNGTIENCHVTATVLIGSAGENPSQHGGIAGWNYSTVDGCTSSATLSEASSCGGIVGFNDGVGIIMNCLAIGVTNNGTSDVGAIAGGNDNGTLSHNYYNSCTAQGRTYNIGCRGDDVTENDGAVQKPVYALTLAEGITITTTPASAFNGSSYSCVEGTTVTLNYTGAAQTGYEVHYSLDGGNTLLASNTFVMPGYDVTVSASCYPIDWATESTGDDADHAYMIYNPEQLDLLAQRVNNGTDYAGKFFKLGADITYTHKAANEEGADTENNFTAIGTNSHPFLGHFDGNNKTISGIRIYTTEKYQGLFGIIGSGAEVKNVILDDARIAGSRYIGGVAGFNKGTLTDNFVIGANICEASSNDYGAIVGHNNSTGTTLQRNYYRACTIAGVANAIDKGCGNNNITDDDGAMPVFTLTMGTGITTTTGATVTYGGTPYYVFGKTIALSGGLDNLGTPGPGYTAGYVTTSGSVSGNATDGFVLTMGYGDATVSASNCYPIDWATESTGDDADHAYMIYNPEQLDLLAQRVNDGEGYAGKFFKLGADIAYAHKAANEEGADTENNYTAIGNNISAVHSFKGTFLGQNHIVSGIRIYKSGTTNADDYQGLFGYVDDTGVISGVIVTDARIVGRNLLGVIAAQVLSYDSLSHNYYFNCTAHGRTYDIGCSGADITDNDGAVSIHALTVATGITATPAPTITISGTPYYKPGTTITLSGEQSDPLSVGSIYDGYIVNGTAISGNTFNMPAEDVTVTSNITPVYALTLADGITATPTPATIVGSTPYYRAGTVVTLSGRPDAEEGYAYPYIINGSPIVGNTFTMPAANVTVSVEKTADWQYGSDGSTEATAYQIKTTFDLDLLAQRVNSGNAYGGKYFKLMNDIAYAHTTAWNDATSTENNYTAIGNYAELFEGTFDGQGHTISGIRIYKGGSDTSSDTFQGLFGHVGGTVENVTLADARITGFQKVGGIVGNNGDGTITGCHVAPDVALHIVQDDAEKFGGIAGFNVFGTVSDCTSAVKITAASGITGYRYMGGIVGESSCTKEDDTFKSTITNCRAIGASVPATSSSGAIVGCYHVEGTSENPLHGRGNAYHSCLVGSDAFNIGVGQYDNISNKESNFKGDCDGASLDASHFLLDDYMDAPALIAAYADPESHTANGGTVPDVSSLNVTLQGRTLYKDGDWNTLCLPFAMTDEQVTAQLAPAALMTLSSSSVSGNTLTLNFTNATSIVAGKPYIIKWDGDGTNNLVNPVFSKVTISAASNPVTTDCVDFIGAYTPVSFTADDHTMLLVGNQNKLYYPKSGASLGICRAYFQLKNGLTVGDANSTAPGLNIQLNFGDGEQTGIRSLSPDPSPSREGSAGAWYDMQGRKLNAQPTAKGIYINNGRKVVIK